MKVVVVRYITRDISYVSQSRIHKGRRMRLGSEIYFGGQPHFVVAVGYEGLQEIPVVHLERVYTDEERDTYGL